MKKKLLLRIFLFFLIISSVIGLIFYYNEKVIITLSGERSIVLNLEDEYTEFGATAKMCSLNKCVDLSDDVVIKEKVNTSVVGDYKVIYQIDYNNKLYTEERNVTVVDTISPVITLTGSKSIQLCPNENYVEEGYGALDNYDGDITNKVIIKEENNVISYNVVDSANNSTEEFRNIEKIDITKPVIKLNGSSTITLKLNEEYKEYGVTVTDNCDMISSDKVDISHNIDTSKEGTYNVTYTVKDESGNVGTATRTVKVKKPVVFDTINKNDYIDSLEAYIKDKNYNVSLGYVNLNTGYTYLYNEKVVYYGASLVKTVDALYVYEKLNFNEATRKKVESAISVSDNTAHRQLVDLIGIENLRSYGRELGANKFLTRSNSDYFGNTTVKDQITIWKYLYEFINSNSKGSELKNYFINTYCNYLLFDGIPTTMHKYGYYGSYFHDVGIVYSDNPYLVVILTKHGNGDFKSVVQDLSKKIYELNKIDD